MTDPRPPKKTDTLEVRMPHDTKRAFLEACRKDGRTASEVVRDFVDGYLSRSATDQLRERLWDPPTAARSLAMILFTPKGRRGVLAAGVGALGLIALSVSPSAAEIDFRAMYDRLDANSDGRITVEEFSEPPVAPANDVVMFVRSNVTRTVDGAEEVEEKQSAETFWLPAPPREPGAPVLTERQQIRVERRVEGGELVTEDVGPMQLTDLRDIRAQEFSMYDADGDGAVDYAEFESRNRSMLENTFSRIDVDGDGVLSAAELNNVPAVIMIGVGPADAPAPPAPPSPYDERAFAALDRNGDGGVSLDEFAAGPATP